MRSEPPSTFKHWSGRIGRVDHPPWPDPGVSVTRAGIMWVEVVHDRHWVHLGYAPRGRTRWERACRHWHHGRLMRYPRLSVLAFIARDLRRPITDRETT